MADDADAPSAAHRPGPGRLGEPGSTSRAIGSCRSSTRSCAASHTTTCAASARATRCRRRRLSTRCTCAWPGSMACAGTTARTFSPWPRRSCGASWWTTPVSAARDKRGAGVSVTSLDENAIAPQPAVDVVALDEALERFATVDPQQGRVVELRFFAGLSVEETAEALGVSPATVKRDWATAKLWLYNELSDPMNTLDDWPRVKRVLEGALAREGADRQAYLAEVVRDRRGAAGADRYPAGRWRPCRDVPRDPGRRAARATRARRPERPCRGLLSPDVTARRGRHGRGLSRPRHEAGSARGGQGPVTGARR